MNSTNSTHSHVAGSTPISQSVDCDQEGDCRSTSPSGSGYVGLESLLEISRAARRGALLGVVCASLFLLSLPAVQWLEFGRSAGERLATDMAKPMGLIWAALTLFAGAGWFGLYWVSRRLKRHIASEQQIASEQSESDRRKDFGARGVMIRRTLPLIVQARWPLLIGWLFVTILGSQQTARWAWSMTEYPFADLDEDLTFEAVVILGGGIGTGPDDLAQLSSDGDRIRPVVQLWQSQRVKKIYVTGSSTIPDRPDPKELTSALLQSFGVPAEAIAEVEGVNTTAEMASLKKIWAQDGTLEVKRALVTSAFHMPRAMRLAESQGLSFHPLPTAYRSSSNKEKRDPVGYAASIVPTGESMEDVGKCQKELLAKLLGR